MEKEILKYIERKGGAVSFVELSRDIANFKGSYAYGLADLNIWFWFNISKEAIGALKSLQEQKLIRIQPANILIYVADGGVPMIPVAKQKRKYKTERWTPVEINLEQGKG